ncbi:hypothetical protein [Xylella fastidiosa]|uniref:hypothetical protein n=1 Tax=Xylella fastidiosa TaxID=2371 RepID=UPI001121CBC1|nr:hypothetical protein [Xylella fastidiosa]
MTASALRQAHPMPPPENPRPSLSRSRPATECCFHWLNPHPQLDMCPRRAPPPWADRLYSADDALLLPRP